MKTTLNTAAATYSSPVAELILLSVESDILQLSGGNIDNGFPGDEDDD